MAKKTVAIASVAIDSPITTESRRAFCLLRILGTRLGEKIASNRSRRDVEIAKKKPNAIAVSAVHSEQHHDQHQRVGRQTCCDRRQRIWAQVHSVATETSVPQDIAIVIANILLLEVRYCWMSPTEHQGESIMFKSEAFAQFKSIDRLSFLTVLTDLEPWTFWERTCRFLQKVVHFPSDG